jgi:hypothetical protein
VFNMSVKSIEFGFAQGEGFHTASVASCPSPLPRRYPVRL